MTEDLKFQATMPRVPAGAPNPGEIYMHTNGGLYRVMLLTNLTNERADHPPDVVYVGENGNIWSRRLSDWSRSMTKVAGNG